MVAEGRTLRVGLGVIVLGRELCVLDLGVMGLDCLGLVGLVAEFGLGGLRLESLPYLSQEFLVVQFVLAQFLAGQFLAGLVGYLYILGDLGFGKSGFFTHFGERGDSLVHAMPPPEGRFEGSAGRRLIAGLGVG
jgi:hypothetical protein